MRVHSCIATLGLSQRAALGGALCVAVLLSTVGLIGNLELHRAQQALDRGDWASAISHADSASNWMPWSYEPDVVRGDGEIGLRRIRPCPRGVQVGGEESTEVSTSGRCGYT